ncbi:unnamed protein product [Paramecium pentaurelia]|uniref:Uncharacterized protein n=1 Tax=Paramecium pentaurelia TaxID=43138 RepID=A0A8S1YI28_9CILI|nr:unnamed protein product [Paramecium pentaurelia]
MKNKLLKALELNFIISIIVFTKQMIYLISKAYFNYPKLIFEIQYQKFYCFNSKTGIREIISSIGYLVSLITIISQNLRRNNHKIILKDLRNKQHDDIILTKKVLFLIVLTIMQSCPLIQCILLTCILIWYLGQIINIYFTRNKLDLYIIIWMEALVMVFMIYTIIF